MSNVIKGNYGYSFQEDTTRVIDMNKLVARKLEVLSEVMQAQAAENGNFEEDFTLGLDAQAVERLLQDSDGQEFDDEGTSGNIIKPIPAKSNEEIQAEVNAILENARNQAELIMEDARTSARQLQEQAVQEGQQEGFDAGYHDGLARAQAEFEQKLTELANREKELEREYNEKVDELEPKFVETLTEVYEHILHVKFSDSKDVIYYLIQDAIRKVETSKTFVVHVSKEDYGFVSMQKKELFAGVAAGDMGEIVEDMTLKPNECFIDTGSGIFDCSLETQLAGLKRELMLLSLGNHDA